MLRRVSLLALFSLLAWVVFCGLDVSTGTPSYYYLLSAVSQGSAAIFAILLSAILIAGQISLEYSLKMPEILIWKPFTLIYFSIIALSIVLPLIPLATNSIPLFMQAGIPDTPLVENLLTRLTLFLIGSYLILALPFFKAFKSYLDPENVIDDIYKEVLQQNLLKLKRVPKKVFIIREISLQLEEKHNIYAFNHGLNRINDFFKALLKAKKDKNSAQTNRYQFAFSLVRTFREIRILVEDNPGATRMVLKGLGNQVRIFREVFSYGHEIFRTIFGEINSLFKSLAKLEEEMVFRHHIYILGGIGEEILHERRVVTVRRVANTLRETIRLSRQNNWTQATLTSIDRIFEILERLLQEKLDKELQKHLRKTCHSIAGNIRNIHSKSFEKDKIEQANYISDLSGDIIHKTLQKRLTKTTKAFISIKTVHVRKIVARDEDRALDDTKSIISYGMRTIKKEKEIAGYCVNALGHIGLGVPVKKQKARLTQKFVGGIGGIGEKSVNQKQQKLIEAAIKNLKELALHFDKNKDMKFSILSGANICKLGAMSSQKNLGIAEYIAHTLSQLQTEINEDFLKQSFKLANQWGVSYLSEFKENFNLGQEPD